VRLPSLIRWITITALAVTAWLATSKHAWAIDAPLCHQYGGSAQGREAVLILDQTTVEFSEPEPTAGDDRRAPTPPKERISDKADPATLTGWVWFARAPVSLVDFVCEQRHGSDGVTTRLERPPRKS
jgi:hypothetical protein